MKNFVKTLLLELINRSIRICILSKRQGVIAQKIIRIYLSELTNVKGKHFGVFVTSGGKRSQKATIQMREYLDSQGMQFLGQMRLLAKDVDDEKYGEIFDLFAKKFID